MNWLKTVLLRLTGTPDRKDASTSAELDGDEGQSQKATEAPAHSMQNVPTPEDVKTAAQTEPDAELLVPDHALTEMKAYALKHRKDSARKSWRKRPDDYAPIKALSLAPICPYCHASLGKRKRPSRRSKFSCKSCGEVIYVDPKQLIFDSVFLDERRGIIARYLGHLDDSIVTAGTNPDFWYVASQINWTKGKASLTTTEAGDVLWGLFNYNVTNLDAICPPDYREGMREHHAELQRKMQEYRRMEEKAKRTYNKPPGKTDGKLRQLCPYCGGDGGLVSKPSRASVRKCRLCKEPIHVTPGRNLFKSQFLTETQSRLLWHLDGLVHRVCTRGSDADFRRVAKQLEHSAPWDTQDVARIIHALIHDNIENVEAYNPDAVKKDRDMVKYLGDNSGSNIGWYREWIEEMLDEFEKDMQEHGIPLDT